MNEIIQAMEERRSIRRFRPEMPAKKELEQIIEAGLYAANGMGKQAVITAAPGHRFRRRQPWGQGFHLPIRRQRWASFYPGRSRPLPPQA